MQKRKPVFIKKTGQHRTIYIKRPRIPSPAPSSVLPGMVKLAKAQRREVEALCRLMTNNAIGAQMLHYLLRWWKTKSHVRMTESDWDERLALTAKEIRQGKKSLLAAGVKVEVKAHKTGRATMFSLDVPRFIKTLKTVIKQSLLTVLKEMGVCPIRTDGSVPIVRMGLSNGVRTNITNSTQNHSHHESDDDEKLNSGDSGEFSVEEKEGKDPAQQNHDASRRFLEEHGVKAPALATAAKHPLQVLQRAFALASEKNASNKAAYALSVLKNGEYQPKPSWMNNNSPLPAQRSGEGLGVRANSSAVKTDFQNQSNPFAGLTWADFASNQLESEKEANV